MDWKKLFTSHILDRGYDYYCDGAVENIDISDEVIKADIIGTEFYEIEISLCNGEVADMHCSCPYAESGSNCKHMAAVLYEWTENDIDKGIDEIDCFHNSHLFKSAHTKNEYNKKMIDIKDLVNSADEDVVRAFLTSVLTDDEKLLLRFNNTVNKKVTKKDIEHYIEQVDAITNHYLGRDCYISYYEAYDFISELEDIIDNDIKHMIDNGFYLSAFEVINYIFQLINNIDIDDSDGCITMLVNSIYDCWLVLLKKVSLEEKRKMFQWFTSRLDGSSDYLEEYIEQIIIEEFKEKEYEQEKLDYIERMIDKSEKKASDDLRDYAIGKWLVRYLELLDEICLSEKQIEEVCKKYWDNSSVRKYYIDFYMEKQEYDKVLQILDECIILDEQYSGLVSEYSEKKKEIYLLQGNKIAYIEQLWELLLKHKAGDIELYRELKNQYTADEWIEKREEVFKNLSEKAIISRLYEEEKLYDRLLTNVLNSQGIYELQKYENVLEKQYPEQILNKYQEEINIMALNANGRRYYSYLVSLLRRIKKINGGSEIVEQIVSDWKVKYKNRPAMMEELSEL